LINFNYSETVLYTVEYLNELRLILFCTGRLKHHSSILTRVIAKLCRRDTLSIAAKYRIKCLDLSVASVKLSVWETFAQFAATAV